MLNYTTAVANAINQYERCFNERISFDRLANSMTEEEFLDTVQTAVAEKQPLESWHKKRPVEFPPFKAEEEESKPKKARKKKAAPAAGQSEPEEKAAPKKTRKRAAKKEG